LGIYLWNRGQVQDANAQRATLQAQSPTEEGHYEQVMSYNDRADSIHRASVFTVGLAVAGGAALAGGIYLWRRGGSHDETPGPAQRPQEGLALHIAPGSAGLGWTGSF
jgi:hypothetical protein